jgi:hypothetical protein
MITCCGSDGGELASTCLAEQVRGRNHEALS